MNDLIVLIKHYRSFLIIEILASLITYSRFDFSFSFLTIRLLIYIDLFLKWIHIAPQVIVWSCAVASSSH